MLLFLMLVSMFFTSLFILGLLGFLMLVLLTTALTVGIAFITVITAVGRRGVAGRSVPALAPALASRPVILANLEIASITRASVAAAAISSPRRGGGIGDGRGGGVRRIGGRR